MKQELDKYKLKQHYIQADSDASDDSDPRNEEVSPLQRVFKNHSQWRYPPGGEAPANGNSD